MFGVTLREETIEIGPGAQSLTWALPTLYTLMVLRGKAPIGSIASLEPVSESRGFGTEVEISEVGGQFRLLPTDRYLLTWSAPGERKEERRVVTIPDQTSVALETWKPNALVVHDIRQHSDASLDLGTGVIIVAGDGTLVSKDVQSARNALEGGETKIVTVVGEGMLEEVPTTQLGSGISTWPVYLRGEDWP